MKKRFVIVAVMLMAAAFVSCKQKEAPKEEAPCETKKVITIEHLQKAIKGETDASVKYATISTEAAKNKMPNTSALFAAASAAEAVHIANHQNALNQLGETYEYTAKTPVLHPDMSINLDSAIIGETYEFIEMYPPFLDSAKANQIEDAVKSFKFAMEAEKHHAALYTKVKEVLKTKGDKAVAKIWYVCPVCGDLYDSEVEVCAICGETKAKFKVFGK